MKKTQLWKRLAAWTLTAAMVFGNSSFLALAEESTQEVSVDAAGEALQEEADAGSDGWSKDELIEEPEGVIADAEDADDDGLPEAAGMDEGNFQEELTIEEIVPLADADEEQIYDIDIWSNTGLQMLPGGSLTLHNEVLGDTSDYEVKWSIAEGEYAVDTIENEDGSLTVTAHEDIQDTQVNIVATAYVQGEEVISRDRWINIQNAYYQIVSDTEHIPLL
jgi:hypothetical protein